MIPASERNQDSERSTHDLVNEVARPLTEEERKAADRDAPVGERIYAPASERVPRTLPDYRNVVEHTDIHTPEREAIGQTEMTNQDEQEPSFTRVPRPSTTPTMTTPYNSTSTSSSDADTDTGTGMGWSPQPERWTSNMTGERMLPIGMGWLALVGGGVGVWVFMRWRRERNKPINRLRRQAKQSADIARRRAYELRDRMPEMPEFPDEATRPAVGLGTALVSLAILLWQQSQSRSRVDEARSRARDVSRRADKASKMSREASRRATKMGKRAADTLSEMDWQDRLMQLRDRWSPSRVELEKISIPKR